MKNSSFPIDLEKATLKDGILASRISGILTELAWQLGPPGAFLLGMLGFFPYWNLFYLVNDEGYNLMKALLVEQGHGLYTQIWSDQAPLLTYILAGLFRLVGYNVDWSRRLTLVFSCLLLWAVVQYLRLTWGKPHALVGAVLLVLLPDYLVVSAAVLVGQPSLAFAALAMLALAAWHLRRRTAYLALSAAAMSLSLLVKLFTGFLVPVFLLGLLAAEAYRSGSKKDWLKLLRPALLWGLVLGALTLGLGLLMVDPSGIAQLVLPHLSAATATEYSQPIEMHTIHEYLLPAWPVLLAALAGVLLVWRQKRWLALYPLAWMVLAYLFLLIDKPVWWHHQMLVTIPSAILAAGFIGDGLQPLLRALRSPTGLRRSWPLLAAALLSLALVAAVRIPDIASYLQNPKPLDFEQRNPAEEKFMRRIEQFAPQTNWMVTDTPMFSFRAGLPSPPELAVMSWKRFAAGEISEADILDTLRAYRPEQIMFARFYFTSLEQYLAENYRLVMERDALRLYIRSDVQKGTALPPE